MCSTGAMAPRAGGDGSAAALSFGVSEGLKQASRARGPRSHAQLWRAGTRLCARICTARMESFWWCEYKYAVRANAGLTDRAEPSCVPHTTHSRADFGTSLSTQPGAPQGILYPGGEIIPRALFLEVVCGQKKSVAPLISKLLKVRMQSMKADAKTCGAEKGGKVREQPSRALGRH